MSDIIVKVANDASAVLGMLAGVIFWIEVCHLIFGGRAG